MSQRFMAMCLLALCVLTAAPASARAEAPQAELDKLKGTWSVVSGSRNGVEAPADKVKDMLVVFDGKNMTMKHGESGSPSIIDNLDPSKSPAWIDINGGPKANDKVGGIYKLDGDTLEICLKQGDRPTDFTAGVGKLVLKLKRQK